MVITVQYTQMMRHFGGLPLIDKAIYPGDDYNYPRETIEKTVNFIVNLCNEAASVLPWRVSVEEDGRFTKAAALGLKVRVLLFAASPLFNDNQPYLDGEASTNLMVWYGEINPINAGRMLWMPVKNSNRRTTRVLITTSWLRQGGLPAGFSGCMV